MRISICLLSLAVCLLTERSEAQSSISVVGRLVTKENVAVARVDVSLGIADQPNVLDRIVKDPTNDLGLFQLAKSTVGNFRELHIWIEKPYAVGPIPVTAMKTDMWRLKLPDIVLSGTMTGMIPPTEAAERVASIYAIEHLKLKLDVQDSAKSKANGDQLATAVLARCENIQQSGTLNLIIADARKLLPKDSVSLFSESESLLVALSKDAKFQLQVKLQQDFHQSATVYLASYLQDESPYDDKFTRYIYGLNAGQIRPEWFANKAASRKVWQGLKPKEGDNFEDVIIIGSPGTEAVDPFLWARPSGLHINANVPPNSDAISDWIKSNPANAKILFKASLLGDPLLSDDKKTEIKLVLKAPQPVLIPMK